MTETLDLLRRPEYLHALLCHFPLVGLAVAVAVLGWALVAEDRIAVLIGLAMVAITAGLAWPVIETGEAAFDRLQATLDTETTALVKTHMITAEPWTALYYLTAVAAVLAALWAWKRPQRFWAPSVVVVALAVLSLVAGLAIAKSGGRVRHPEFRASPASSPPDDISPAPGSR
jgi:hypothetical protein